ncbi:ERO1-like protein alpha [Seminavis robusta]|uniref:ERO1-like protein alpha n=1 Tax=Seminavis robusta TaxID=568900 RepID=A0A9N8H5W0_9STRA|nr:ERO1-like protein alpha [Seminavis robusta]|eukprot:Sro97_g049910.1 ERO1-like protein alpha (1276) ;mRNA; r:37381-41208
MRHHQLLPLSVIGVSLVLALTQATPTITSSASPVATLLPTAPSADAQAGPIDDTQCNIEELEQANDSQLYTILQELVLRTEFFQHFAVDLEQTCPLSKEDSEQEEEEEFECAGGPAEPDPLLDAFGMAEEEPAEPACHVDTSAQEFQADNPFMTTATSSTTSSPSNTPHTQSQALYELSKQGFQSKEQAGAFQWKQQTDLVEPKPLGAKNKENQDTPVTSSTTSKQSAKTTNIKKEEEDDCALDIDADHNNGQQQWLPEAFWMDMCSHVTAGGTTKIVNLALNPERNTGYNGTHLWNAIYQENCIGIASTNSNTNTNTQDKSVLPFVDDNNKEVQPRCFEERVLYRLLSGLHTSTTLSIAKHYYMPSKRKGRINWEPNPQYFMERFKDHPEYIRNLHFSYVVLLRALKKATPFLYNYEIRTGNIVQDEAATILLKRLLDSSILQSCSSVFGAFDETLMFRQELENTNESDAIALQQSFKGVFHNISSILDCVQCQQCKLHGKMAMLGYGTALKILFIKPSALQLERNEIVAFINTLAKLSQSIREVRELTHLYWMREQEKQQREIDKATLNATTVSSHAESIPITKAGWDSWNTVDGAIGAIAALERQKLISVEQEAQLVTLAIEQRDPVLLILTKHYFSSSPDDSQADLVKLRDLLQARGLLDGTVTAVTVPVDPLDYPDAVVVGSGLAGLAAALNILDRGGYVVLLEKEHLLGGNSNKASSGINACCPGQNNNTSSKSDALAAADSVEIFTNDTIRSAGTAARPDLIQVLVSNSESAVEWLQSRVGVDLSLKAQLGGHSSKRTHRPSNGMAGAEIIYGMQKAVRKYEKKGQVRILVDTKVTQLITEESDLEADKFNEKTVVGVEYENMKDPGTKVTLMAPHIIMATGGFASDRRPKESYLSQYRPELLQFPTTAGAFSTGDGIALATSLGADTASMDQVQIHPTGWVDPTDPKNPSKTLAAELMRGVGGILLNDKGQRFCNELGTRAYVTDKMLAHNWKYYMTSKWDANSEIPTFALVLSSAASSDAKKHVDLYSHKGLLKRLEGVQALADWMGQPVKTVASALNKYQADADKGKDEYGKTTFRGQFGKDLTKEIFYAGTVSPVLHYCMGGITIDTDGNVLDTQKRIISGLHAAGEVTGGVHGNNRLAGNSLLECTVFGSLVGRNLPLQERQVTEQQRVKATSGDEPASNSPSSDSKKRQVSREELAQHNTPEDCWVAIHGVVYDLTEFAEEHPAGPASIRELAGQDGTEAFAAVHNQNILEDFDEDRIGILV